MYTIDKEHRRIIITPEQETTYSQKIINEFDKLKRKFLEGTQDKYMCELVILDVDVKDMETGRKTGIETKAFARRIGQPNWLIEFVEDEYIL